jgi:hypothetical protein
MPDNPDSAVFECVTTVMAGNYSGKVGTYKILPHSTQSLMDIDICIGHFQVN